MNIREVQSLEEIEQAVAFMQSALSTRLDLSRQAGVRFAISQLETLKGDLPAALRQVSQAINTGALGYMECRRTQSSQGLPARLEARNILLKLGRNDLVRLVEQDIQKFDLSV